MKYKLRNTWLFPVLCCWIWSVSGCAEYKDVRGKDPQNAGKVNGICIEGPPRPVESSVFISLQETGSNWVAITPYAFLAEGATTLQWNAGYTWWGERKQGVLKCIEFAKQYGLNVMLKPHVWMAHGKYTGTMTFKDEAGWNAFETSYQKYVMDYLEMLDSEQVDIICLGTELDEFARRRPEFWKNLARKIRDTYGVPTTYSANWDTYRSLIIWSAMDYIGVSAYFPLNVTNPTSESELAHAWKAHKGQLFLVSKKYDKPILFTEYGYRSIDNCVREPWDSHSKSTPNELAQKTAYKVLYDVWWKEKWFAGGFAWKWYLHDNYSAEQMATDYSIKGKPAMDIMKSNYGKYKQ